MLRLGLLKYEHERLRHLGKTQKTYLSLLPFWPRDYSIHVAPSDRLLLLLLITINPDNSTEERRFSEMLKL